MISRTGYTGEDGFELYHAAGDAVVLAEALLEAGKSHGLELCGLGARGQPAPRRPGYPLYGHEIDAEVSPLAAGLGWTVKLDKGVDFIGAVGPGGGEAARLGPPHRLFQDGRPPDRPARGPGVCGAAGATVGTVRSGTLSPILNEAIGSALVDAAAVGQPLTVGHSRHPDLDFASRQTLFVELKKATL